MFIAGGVDVRLKKKICDTREEDLDDMSENSDIIYKEVFMSLQSSLNLVSIIYNEEDVLFRQNYVTTKVYGRSNYFTFNSKPQLWPSEPTIVIMYYIRLSNDFLNRPYKLGVNYKSI